MFIRFRIAFFTSFGREMHLSVVFSCQFGVVLYDKDIQSLTFYPPPIVKIC